MPLRRLPILAALVCLSVLPGCVSLLFGTRGTPPRYAIEAIDYTPEGAEALTARLIIDDPRAEAVFDTALIARAPSRQRYEYFEKAEWADRVPRLFGNFLERSFENVDGGLIIGDRTTLLVGDYILQIDIRHFHMDETGETSTARVGFYARLLTSRNRVLGARLFEGRARAAGPGLEGSIGAFNEAASSVGRQTIDWVTDIIDDDMKATRQPS